MVFKEIIEFVDVNGKFIVFGVYVYLGMFYFEMGNL